MLRQPIIVYTYNSLEVIGIIQQEKNVISYIIQNRWE